MKKILSLVLSLTLIIALGSVCFAAQEDTTIKATEVPKASVESVDKSTYSTPSIKSGEELIPGGSVASVEKLPKTGGIPAEAFYVAGVLLIVAALVISKKKVKVASKN